MIGKKASKGAKGCQIVNRRSKNSFVNLNCPIGNQNGEGDDRVR
jgi:hypothetical protein